MSQDAQVLAAALPAYAPPTTPPARSTPRIEGDDFCAGRPLVLPGGTTVRFGDARWTLQEDPPVTAGFEDLPAWLLEPTKRYVAMLWLDEAKPPTTLSAALRAARWWGRTLGETVARDLRDLSADHVRRVRDRLAEEGETARAALEAAHEAAQREGRTLGQRARRRVVREVGGRVQLSAIAGQIDAICDVARTQLGWAIHFHVGSVENPAVENRGPWSADASKVVSHEARRALVAVLNREIAAYEAARDRIRELLAAADYDALAAKLGTRALGGENLVKKATGRPVKADQVRLVLDCYLGLGGRAMHSNDALAAVLKLAPSSGATIGRQAKRYLALYMDDAAVAQIARLRQAIMYRKQPVVGHDAERVELLALARAHGVPGAAAALADAGGRASAPRSLAHAAGVAAIDLPDADVTLDRAAIEAYCGLRDGTLWSYEQVNTLYGYGSGPGTSAMGRRRMVERLPLLLGEDRAEELLRVRDTHDELLSRALKACAVKLELAAARRVNALLDLQAEPKVETHHLGGHAGGGDPLPGVEGVG
ncbi:MAG: hypothetical protein JOY78_10955 [Pseudonocardia sp.]|nr:hypothetical protein [Pseudonocardia sp.]